MHFSERAASITKDSSILSRDQIRQGDGNGVQNGRTKFSLPLEEDLRST
jgi:hypothetical protein